MVNKLAVFDFDSTLMNGETLEILAREVGYAEKVKVVTERAMRGEIDLFERHIERVAVLKGISYSDVQKICKELPIMPGAFDVVKGLKKKGYKVICFSGGFDCATEVFKKQLSLDATFSNYFHVKDNVLTGLVGGEMMFNCSKGLMLQRLQKILDVSPKNTLVVGDGANDLSMFACSENCVAFCAKPVLEKEANIIIKKQDLSEILSYI